MDIGEGVERLAHPIQHQDMVIGDHDADGLAHFTSQATVTVVAGGEPQTARIAAQLPQGCHVESVPDLAVVCVVGGALADDGDLRRRVLEVLAAHEPLVVALGARATSVAAVVVESRLEDAVRDVHRRFFE